MHLTSGERPLPTCCTRRTRRSAPPRWRKNSPSRARSSWAISRCCAPRARNSRHSARLCDAEGGTRHPPPCRREAHAAGDGSRAQRHRRQRLYGHRRHRRPPHLRPAHRPAANFEPLRGQQFIERCKKAEPLSSLTDGIHLHTLSCPDEAAFERTKSALRALRVLLEENGD